MEERITCDRTQYFTLRLLGRQPDKPLQKFGITALSPSCRTGFAETGVLPRVLRSKPVRARNSGTGNGVEVCGRRERDQQQHKHHRDSDGYFRALGRARRAGPGLRGNLLDRHLSGFAKLVGGGRKRSSRLRGAAARRKTGDCIPSQRGHIIASITMKILSKAACRIDLAGGTLDIWPLCLYHDNAVTVNFAVDRYASCVLETRADSRIVLRSRRMNAEESFDSIEDLCAARRYRLPLLAYQLRFFRPKTGLVLETDFEAPVGAGIAGSSALIIAINSVLNRLTGSGYSLERIRQISQNIESQLIRVPTGPQDYYPAMYGGVNAIELGPAGVRRRAIPVDFDELNQRTVLAYTGEPRESGINNWEVMKAHIDGDRRVHRNFDRIAAIAQAMRAALEKADWEQVGRLLRQEWSHRRRNAPGITTPLIDRLVKTTRRAGAVAAKVCGAGGGGCVFLLVEPGKKARVSATVEREGAEVLPVSVAPRGVRVRTVSK